ncbi:aminodeoxychorismate lyase [Citricoccus sp. SGAir0253]|uniref:aminotransferase class IV n=1 Tax=Citricoccus sp. SGAir0253 TaxID=2567881 RepID=UPI0010CCB785|nr:aminotransferase class IV [Citricoccus sp. SGAir0253]QCU77293.1 aminodeoxychorismate lyase [Citricoccus sp. SGAir0253]
MTKAPAASRATPGGPFVPAAGGSVVVFLEPSPAGPAIRVADPRQPAVLVTDQGLTRGDGIFETMTAVAGPSGHRIRKEDSHLERLAASAEALELPVPSGSTWRRAALAGLEAYAAGNPGRDAVVKLVATRGPEGAPGGGHYVHGTADTGSDGELTDHTSPAAARSGAAAAPGATAGGPGAADAAGLTGTYWVLVSPVSPGLAATRREGLDVLLLDRGFDSAAAERAPWLLLGAKTLSYAVNMAAMRHAAAQGADDVIFVSADGKVLEGPTSTVLMARRVPAAGGRGTTVELVTPLRSSGILPGTSQGTIFAAAQAAGWDLGYGPLVPSDLLDADGVWLVSSVRGVAPVKSLDGVALGVDAELTDRLTAFLAEDLAPGQHGPLG